jgi:hypothetical protein
VGGISRLLTLRLLPLFNEPLLDGHLPQLALDALELLA